MSDPTWRYGIATPSGGESTARGYSILGCVNQLGHQMRALLREGACTCGAPHPAGRLNLNSDPAKRCRACKDYGSAMTRLNLAREFGLMFSSAEFAGRTVFYRLEEEVNEK